jgi:hypothetical protein
VSQFDFIVASNVLTRAPMPNDSTLAPGVRLSADVAVHFLFAEWFEISGLLPPD